MSESIVDINDKAGRRIEINRIGEKYYVTVDGAMTQKDLGADAVIRWMGNAMHVEPKPVKSTK
jgi:hypothetical protein